VELASQGFSSRGGLWRVAVRGDKVVVVGQSFPENKGIVLVSEDRGKRWRDASPRDGGRLIAALLSNVWLFEDGSVLVAGEGELWRGRL
jgi:photosystem II stability/assembly factor-like uncharacterized protein